MPNDQITKIKRGFTLFEVLIIVGIMVILLSITVVSLRFFQKKSDLDIAGQEIISILRTAQNKTLSSEQESQYGVYFNNAASPNQYVLFKGENYASRDASFDQEYTVPEPVEISQINLGTNSEVVFSRLEGRASQSGNLIISLVENPSENKIIYIEDSGMVTLSGQIPSTEGRITDSRHVHFALGWSIQNSLFLKFYFPNVPQTETVDMTTYFNFSKTDFDWNGTFTAAGTEQQFRIHTHFLDAFDTLLCIHRDRNQGKNNQELIVYIVDGGIDKEIAHYLADEDDTTLKGMQVETMEIQ